MTELHRPEIAILASGSGTTAEAFILATRAGYVDADVRLVISNNGDAGVFDKVDRLNTNKRKPIDVLHISGVTHPDMPVAPGSQTLAESVALCEAIEERDIALVAMMGYMKRVNGQLLERFGSGAPEPDGSRRPARLINTHPGPLPATRGLYGIHVQEAVLKSKLKFSAQTLHEVTGDYDTGSVIKYVPVPVRQNDTPETLSAAVQQAEKMWLPWEVQSYLHLLGLSDHMPGNRRKG